MTRTKTGGWWLLAVLAPPLLAGCVTDHAPLVPPDGEPPLRFLVIGDQGTGDAAQARVAHAMAAVCLARGCDMVIGTGDTVYEAGVAGPYDPRFQAYFEVPYARFGIPFYLTLGNHDIADTPSGWVFGDHQVAYHHRDDRSDASQQRWRMPDRWYSHDHPVPAADGRDAGASARFIALDTNILWGDDAAWSRDPGGVAQGAFVDQAVEDASDAAGWVFAHGHHPYISNGHHGDAAPRLEAWYEKHVCGEVDILFSGHDHDLQWLEPVPECGDTVQIVSGAAAKTRPTTEVPRHDARFVVGDTYGFLWAEVEGDRFTGVFYDEAGAVLHAGTLRR